MKKKIEELYHSNGHNTSVIWHWRKYVSTSKKKQQTYAMDLQHSVMPRGLGKVHTLYSETWYSNVTIIQPWTYVLCVLYYDWCTPSEFLKVSPEFLYFDEQSGQIYRSVTHYIGLASKISSLVVSMNRVVWDGVKFLCGLSTALAIVTLSSRTIKLLIIKTQQN